MTSAAALTPLATRPDSDRLVLDVSVPVFNEETDLEPCVRRLHAHLEQHFPYRFSITVADNASTDSTPLVAARLARELPGVRHVRLEQKGRGRALQHGVARPRGPRWSPTWTWTCPPTSTPCCRWSRR